MDRLPCFKTGIPAAAKTNVTVVLILNVLLVSARATYIDRRSSLNPDLEPILDNALPIQPLWSLLPFWPAMLRIPLHARIHLSRS